MKFLRLIICLISFSSLAQRHATDSSKFGHEQFSVSVSPLALVDVYNGALLKCGFTYRPIPSIRLSSDYGWYLKNLSESVVYWYNMDGNNFRASFEYSPNLTFVNRGSRNLHFGIEYQYKTQAFSYFDSIHDAMDFEATVTKFAHVLNGCLGFDIYVSPRFYLEFKGGLGVRYRDIFNTHNQTLYDSINWRDAMTQGRIRTQQRSMVNLSVAIRLNYIVFKHKK